jgi:PAS domain S-box-containing protein
LREIQSIADKVGGAHRYALAALLVFAATAARFSAEGLIPNQPFPSYFFAVLVTAAVAGAAPTALATMLSAIVGSYFFIEPHGSWHIGEKADLVRTVVFVFVGLSVAAFAYAGERAFRRAVTAEVALAEARSRETAAANLKTREAFIAGVLDSLPHNIAVISATGVVLSINRQWQSFAVENDGSRAFVSVGANYLAVSRSAAERGDRYARDALQGLESLLRGEQTSFEMEYPCHAPNQERWFVMHAARAESAPAAVVISHTDITERKRALDAFRESEERFASFMRNLPGLAWIKDLQGRYLYATETTMRAFRTTQEKLYGNTDDRIFDAETAAQFRRNDEKALTSEKGVISVETLAQDDGRIHHSIVSKFPIKDADDVPCAVGGVAIDITERVEAERQLRDATKRLQEADRRKDEFLATLAHELRNPLAPIYNAVSLLRRDAVDSGWNERRLKLLSMAERQIHHLIRLVDDLLEVSRISCGKIALKKQDMDLAEALRNAIDVAAPVLAERGHKLDLSVPDEPLIVSADSVRLTQIFANLLNNAANYTEPGGVISVEARRGRDEAIVAVRDSGVGIAADMLPRIFDLFTQVDQSSGPRRAGLGIGLALVRSLVEMHGGRVEAQSDGVGQGSVFTVRLPLRPAGSVGATQGARPETPAQPGRRILVIDDEHDVADSLVMLLEMLGAKTEVAYNGESGLAKLREFNPDVVFLDLGMPQMDGYETARRIRALPEGRTVKLIALTGWGDNMIFPRPLEAGFDKKMTKPASFESLRDAVAS